MTLTKKQKRKPSKLITQTVDSKLDYSKLILMFYVGMTNH